MKYIILEKLREKFVGYERHDQIYVLGALLVYILFFLFVPLSVFIPRDSIQPFLNFSGLLIASIFTLAATLEFWVPIKSLIEKTWFKWCIGVVSILVFKYSQVQSDNFINTLTGIDPSFLSFSSSVLTAIYLPYSWLIVVALILSLYMLIHWFFIPFERMSKKRQLDGWKYLARTLGVAVIFYLAGNLIDFFEDPKSLVSTIAKYIVLGTEYFPKTHCQNVASHELSADIGNSYISIFDSNTNTFRTEACNLKFSE